MENGMRVIDYVKTYTLGIVIAGTFLFCMMYFPYQAKTCKALSKAGYSRQYVFNNCVDPSNIDKYKYCLTCYSF